MEIKCPNGTFTQGGLCREGPERETGWCCPERGVRVPQAAPVITPHHHTWLCREDRREGSQLGQRPEPSTVTRMRNDDSLAGSSSQPPA